MYDLREHTRSWPNDIHIKDVKKLYDGSGSFNDFLWRFQLSTGYLQRGSKLSKEFDFDDPTLREISFDLLEYPPHLKENRIPIIKVHTCPIVDYRAIIAIRIIEMMFWFNPLLSRDLNEEGYNKIGSQIINQIPLSPRWVNPRLEGIYEKFENQDYDMLTDDNFRFLNLVESRQLGMIAWYASWSRNKRKVDRILKPFLMKLGLKSVSDYMRATLLPHDAISDPDDYSRKKIRREVIEQYAKMSGITPRSLMFQKENLKTIRLIELDQSFMPLFYEREDGVFMAQVLLRDVNDMGGLCYSLPVARKNIVDSAFKGTVFEDFLFDILTGKIGIKHLNSKMYGHACAFVDGATSNSSVHNYTYEPPTNFNHPRIHIMRSWNTFRPLLLQLDKDETDIDLILIHHDEPKHILISECKFTKRYDEIEYHHAMSHIKTITDFLRKENKAMAELGIPLGIPLIPTIFTSFSGPIYKDEKDILKSTSHPIITTNFTTYVQKYLESSIR